MSETKHWMSWEGGVDLVASTSAALEAPNVIVHVARMVHTPVGSAAAGMVFYQPDVNAGPAVMGFISTDAAVAAYFGPNIFASTPFEGAPAYPAHITISNDGLDSAVANIVLEDYAFEVVMTGLGPQELIARDPGGMTPFYQYGLEAVPSLVSLRINGQPVEVTIPEIGISGGPAAVYASIGTYEP